MEKHFPHQVFNRAILFSRQTSPTRHHPRPSRRAPCQGGLQEDDFDELFRALGLEGDDEQRQRERERERAELWQRSALERMIIKERSAII